jgi:hypothetical protein
MLYKMLLVEVSAHFAIAETPKLRQLFVTQSRILAEKVGEHFAKLLAGYKPATRSQTLKAVKKADRALVDEDEENEWRSDLPKRFSDLVDEDFPLFVSFDQVGVVQFDEARHNVYIYPPSFVPWLNATWKHMLMWQGS